MNCHGWLFPRMVTRHPKDGHPPSKTYQKEVYYRLEIWHMDLTHKIKTHYPKYPPTFPRITTERVVTHDLKHNHPLTKLD